MFSLGFDLFYEYATSKYHDEGDGGTSMDAKAKISNPGIIASVRFGPENIPIMAKFGIARPSIKGKSTGAATVEIESDKGHMVEFGGEAGLPLKEFRCTVGFDWIFEGYAFTVDSNDGQEHNNNRLAFYGGIEGALFSNATWGALYDLNVFNRDSSVTASDTNKCRSVIQRISGGIENKWTSVWIFDEFFARGGLLFTITTPILYRANVGSRIRDREQTTFAPVVPTIGAGIKKSYFNLDITVNPTVWAGLVSGPQVGMVTATLKF